MGNQTSIDEKEVLGENAHDILRPKKVLDIDYFTHFFELCDYIIVNNTNEEKQNQLTPIRENLSTSSLIFIENTKNIVNTMKQYKSIKEAYDMNKNEANYDKMERMWRVTSLNLFKYIGMFYVCIKRLEGGKYQYVIDEFFNFIDTQHYVMELLYLKHVIKTHKTCTGK
uniref:Uncharacterized protein n=1 Tax=Drosophila-associated filamentous virus TaxID=2743186 RepID=A0A6M9TZY1_9VIRU|nr:putative protein 36 [Drosophila-associated filamentous virus]